MGLRSPPHTHPAVQNDPYCGVRLACHSELEEWLTMPDYRICAG